MSLRLRIASVWLPSSLKKRELMRIWSGTNTVLDAILEKYGVHVITSPVIRTDLAEMRSAMAKGHEERVMALVGAVGKEEAIRVARNALYQKGVELGREARERLHVGSSKGDLVRAARVMYGVLGIEFKMVDDEDGQRMEVVRCPLSVKYSQLACLMMSAVDEGSVTGLNPHAVMRFKERNTGNTPNCSACIVIEVTP